jgi:hypothetical protein
MTDPMEFERLDDGLIDRIDDGDQTPAELRAAVDRLDRQPDGWKRCTLAYVEAQCWREAFRALDEPARSRRVLPVHASPPRAPRTNRMTPPWLRSAMAAGVLAATFSLGWLAHAARPGSAADRSTLVEPQVVIAQSGDPEPPPGTPGVDDPSRPSRAGAREPQQDDSFPRNSNEVVVALARLQIGSEGNTAEVPVLAGPGITEDWLKEQQPPLTEYGQSWWQRRGFQVDQHRQLITTTLADGRCIAVPVDQVEFRYTGNQPL